MREVAAQSAAFFVGFPDDRSAGGIERH